MVLGDLPKCWVSLGFPLKNNQREFSKKETQILLVPKKKSEVDKVLNDVNQGSMPSSTHARRPRTSPAIEIKRHVGCSRLS